MLIFKKLVIFKVVFKSLLGRKFMNVDSLVSIHTLSLVLLPSHLHLQPLFSHGNMAASSRELGSDDGKRLRRPFQLLLVL